MTGANVLTEVDASTDAAANVIKLNLSDLLSNGTSTHTTLKLTGDSNDTVDLDLAHWTSTGTTVASNGHTYNVYNAAVSSASTAAEQLLIDQHMLITQHA
jgi:predicted HAD superfamily phosphohydrolase